MLFSLLALLPLTLQTDSALEEALARAGENRAQLEAALDAVEDSERPDWSS